MAPEGGSKRPKVFGGELPVGSKDHLVPNVVRECVLAIEKFSNLKGLFEGDEESPYREQVKQFRAQLEKVKKGSISTLIPNGHVACGILKVYLQELAVPVMPLELLGNVFKQNSSIGKYVMFQSILSELPSQNRTLFLYLISFCRRLVQKQDLKIERLAEKLGPYVVRGQELCENDRPMASEVFQVVLSHFVDHFPPGTNFPTAPAAPSVSVGEDDEVEGGYIAVRVTNYQVTSLMPGVKVKSVRALFKFDARKATEITIEPGDIIEITYQDDQPGWWEGKLRGSVGLFPSNYCEVYEILKRKTRKMKIDTTKVSNKILMMQYALNFDRKPRDNDGKSDKDEKEEDVDLVKEDKPQKEQKQEKLEQNTPPFAFKEIPDVTELGKLNLVKLIGQHSISQINGKNAMDIAANYHQMLQIAQKQLFTDIQNGESNELVEFYIEDEEETETQREIEERRALAQKLKEKEELVRKEAEERKRHIQKIEREVQLEQERKQEQLKKEQEELRKQTEQFKKHLDIPTEVKKDLSQDQKSPKNESETKKKEKKRKGSNISDTSPRSPKKLALDKIAPVAEPKAKEPKSPRSKSEKKKTSKLSVEAKAPKSRTPRKSDVKKAKSKDETPTKSKDKSKEGKTTKSDSKPKPEQTDSKPRKSEKKSDRKLETEPEKLQSKPEPVSVEIKLDAKETPEVKKPKPKSKIKSSDEKPKPEQSDPKPRKSDKKSDRKQSKPESVVEESKPRETETPKVEEPPKEAKPSVNLTPEKPKADKSKSTNEKPKVAEPKSEKLQPKLEPIVEEPKTNVGDMKKQFDQKVEELKPSKADAYKPKVKSPLVPRRQAKETKPEVKEPVAVKVSKPIEKESKPEVASKVQVNDVAVEDQPSKPLGDASEAFKADRKLYEQYQELMKLIEEERAKQAGLDSELEAVTLNLISVVSQFEERVVSKNQLMRSIQKAR